MGIPLSEAVAYGRDDTPAKDTGCFIAPRCVDCPLPDGCYFELTPAEQRTVRAAWQARQKAKGSA